MSVGIVDTTVILHYFRKYGAAREWVDSQPLPLSVVSTTWFELLYLTLADQQWAMQQLTHFQFSHHLGKDDCLIASVAYRLQLPLYTHNLKDMTPLLGALAVKPYG